VIAAVIGTSCGATAGYWLPPARTSGEVSSVAVAAGPLPAPDASITVLPTAPSADPPPKAKPQTTPASASNVDPRDAVPRARALAQRADVAGLVALRDAVRAGAENTGQLDSPATQRQLDEIDRFLFEARALRLELDAEELRKGAPDRNPREPRSR
jgi:hypothetical protein